MDVYHVRPCSILPLGKQGENLAKQIQFDLSRWISSFGPGTVQLLHQRSGDETPYPVAVKQEGNLAFWNLTSADTAAPGNGHAELQYYVGDTLAKSETWMTKVLPALGDASETPPEAQQGWVEQVLQAGTVAAEAANRAENAAIRQPYPNEETGTWWVWDAETGAYEDTGISYGTGSGGGGTSDHAELINRDAADQHPMSAITGLEDALEGKQPTGDYLESSLWVVNITKNSDGTYSADKTVGEIYDAYDSGKYYIVAKYGNESIPLSVFTGIEFIFSATVRYAGVTTTTSVHIKINGSVVYYEAEVPTKDDIPTTAEDVGADPAGTAASQVSAHNTETTAHNDIRLLIHGLTDRLNALADSDDTTLDQLSEIVAYIKSNRELIDAITTSKVSVSDIVDNLTTNVANKPLSAAQGVALKALIDAITVPDKLPNPNALTFSGAATGSYDGSAPLEVEIPSGGGGDDVIDILMDVTIAEAVSAVTVTLDTPRAYKELYIATMMYGDESNSSANAMFLRVNNTETMNDNGVIAWIPAVENAVLNTAKSYGIAFVKLLDDCSLYYSYGSKSANARTPRSSYGEMYTDFNRETIISTLKFQSVNQWTNFGVGSTIKVYGVRT